MRTSTSRRSAGALVAVFAATLLLPFATLARTSRAPAEPHGCHCPVKMACCEAGFCHGGEATERSDGPSWSGCRDEAPARAEAPAPSDAFDGALLAEAARLAADHGTPSSFVTTALPGSLSPAPAIPPPRSSVVAC